MLKQKVLIVDDDENIAELIALYLNKECIETKISSDGLQAINDFKEFNPDLVLLDIMLPVMDGYQVCREIRATSQVPIIMLSAKGEVFDKVLGLELGADDYVAKPFDTKELVARCKANLRRKNIEVAIAPPTDDDVDMVSFPDLEVNLTNYTVKYKGDAIEMAPKEIELLYFLASNANKVFSREKLLDNVWGYDFIGDTRTVDVHVKRIREKLNDSPHWAISTVWSVGYKFETK